MQSQLGWVWLSREERRAAEAALADFGAHGTRDELGFGVIHFAYADRFFPGTSVQHTSLRYLWFVCWTYQELAERHGSGPFPTSERDRVEDRLGHKLLRRYGSGDGTGIIGGRVLRAGRSPVTKPSAVYWNAMRSWGLVTPLPRHDEAPARSEVEWRWAELTSREGSPEVDVSGRHPLFADPPRAPKGWRTADPISFELHDNPKEASRIREGWRAQSDPLGRRTLLSRLAERGQPAPERLGGKSVLALCAPDEQASLARAERAGSLAAIARSVHTCMVQNLKDPDGDLARQARAWLTQAVAAHSAAASQLDLPGLAIDVPAIGTLLHLIEATQHWLSRGAGELSELEPLYRQREMEQRPERALLDLDASARRNVWRAAPRSPLTYRWEEVRGFLGELSSA